MSSCQENCRDMLLDYARGRLVHEESQLVENHLERCPDCLIELKIIRQFESRDLPEPPPWFFNSLPEKVTAQVEERRKKRMRWMVPAWAGGMAAAVAAVLMLLQPGPPTRVEDLGSDYSLVRAEDPFSLGIEEELLHVSGVFINDLIQTLGPDLREVKDDSLITMDLIPEGDGYESMSEETMRIFEDLLEKMAPERVRKKVMS